MAKKLNPARVLAIDGRPRIDNRRVFEGILWILCTGALWEDVPKQSASGSTCWRRLRGWEEQDIWLDLWRAFLANPVNRPCWDSNPGPTA